MDPLVMIFVIAILILSVVIHEVSHGYAAQALGDPTARLAGRLTLNPIKHIDPLGTIIIPAILVLTNANFLIGWAKPVPYNPYNLRNQKWGEALVAGAGPATNLFLAVVFGLLLRFGADLIPDASIPLVVYAVYINILLAMFNLLPIPPLDGSKVLSALLPLSLRMQYDRLVGAFMNLGFLVSIGVLYIVIMLLWTPFSLVVDGLFILITGASF